MAQQALRSRGHPAWPWLLSGMVAKHRLTSWVFAKLPGEGEAALEYGLGA